MSKLVNLGPQLRDAGRFASKLDRDIGDVFMCANWVRKGARTRDELVDQLLEAVDRLRKTVETGG